MKNPIPLLAVILLGWIFGLSYCMSHSPCVTPASAALSVATPAAATNLLISDGAKQFSASSTDNLQFDPNGFAHIQPLNDSVQSVYQRTAAYLKANPDRTMRITGYYKESETNTSILPNLGLARAEDVKKILVGLGAPESQLETAGEMLKDLALTNNRYVGPVAYTFGQLVAKDEKADMSDRANKLKAEPITLYFNTDAKSLTLSEKQRATFAEMVHYLSQKPDAKAKVVGHTDNRGKESMNQKLSEDRAEFVKKCLTENNINAAQITVVGAGSSKPVAPNDKAANWAKNRRVEVIVE
jgi:outer membrane protein OmpA-like peptidoglycan-associated protein